MNNLNTFGKKATGGATVTVLKKEITTISVSGIYT
jgi:hypothetical protein